MFEKLDLFILDGIFQKIADWVNDRYGKSCFWLAKICFWLMIALQTARLFLEGVSPLNTTLYIVLGAVLLWNIRIAERRDAMSDARSTMNSMRIQAAWLRQAYLLMSIAVELLAHFKDLMAGNWILPAMYMGSDLLFLSAFYFLSCTPRPPKPLKAGNEFATAPVPTR